jgi:hypothetical protein
MSSRYLFTRKETSMSTAKIAVPTLLAVFALLFAFKTVGIGTAAAPDSPAAEVAAPTPYSADHARIAAGNDDAKEPAPTF